VLVDDEPLAREQLRGLLAPETEIQIVGEAGGGHAAIELIRDLKPDLAFLDVQMPGCDGFEVLRRVGNELPAVVFVTAFDKHAVHAFEVAAIDYVLKPVSEERIRAAVRRVVGKQRGSADASRKILDLLERVVAPTADTLALWSDGRSVFLSFNAIDLVEADDDHVRVHVGATVHTSRDTLANIEQRLPRTFLRVHRSSIVNTQRIHEVHPWFKGDFLVVMRNGARIVTGRTYRERVLALIAGRNS